MSEVLTPAQKQQKKRWLRRKKERKENERFRAFMQRLDCLLEKKPVKAKVMVS